MYVVFQFRKNLIIFYFFVFVLKIPGRIFFPGHLKPMLNPGYDPNYTL